MNILLIGEFSGFNYNLKKGLEELGHKVVLASYGDGFRNFSRDIDFSYRSNSFCKKCIKHVYPLKYSHRLKDFDIVQFINPKIFSDRLGMNKLMINEIIKQNNRVFLSATGSDAVFWHLGKSKLEYNPLDEWKKYDNLGFVEYIETEKAFKWNVELANKVHGIIPSMYEYQIGYQIFSNLKSIIPIPYDVESLPLMENKISNKVVILHGISRPGFKGTVYIKEAMEKIRSKYPNEVELCFPQNLNFKDYLKEVMRSNIVIDQANSYSWGVNAIISMGLGKIVLSGCEAKTLDAFRLKHAPIFNIKPNIEHIFQMLESLLINKKNFIEHGMISRIFAMEFHDAKHVANSYINQWEI